MTKTTFKSITLIVAAAFLTVCMSHAQDMTDGDIIHMKNANGTLTADNLVEIGNTSNSTSLSLNFRVTMSADVLIGTLINVVTLVPTNQTAPTPTFHYKDGAQWTALQTTTTNNVNSIAYSALETIATAQSATTVEVRVTYSTAPTYRFQLELGHGASAAASLDRIYFDCQTGAISRTAYDVTSDGTIDNDDITAVSTAITDKSLTGDVSEDGRINYVDFDMITFIVSQGGGSITLNRAPVVTTIPDVRIDNSQTGEVYAHLHFSDPDGDALTYTATSSDDNTAQVGVGGVGSSTVYIYANALGTVTITVTATDPGGLSVTQTFSATVVQPNRAPVAVGSIPARTVKVGIDAAAIDVSGYFSDPDSDALTYTAASSDTTKATVSVSNSTATIIAAGVGTATITVTASDPDGLSATQSISVTVANREPTTVGTIPNQIVATGGGARAIDLSAYFSDPEGETLSYAATSSNTSLVTVSVSTSILTVTGKDKGTSTIAVTGTDPHNLSATQSFTVTVKDPPTAVGTMPDIAGALNQVGGYIDLSGYFSDPGGQALTYSAVSSDTSVVKTAITTAPNSKLQVIPWGEGTATITVTATNPDGLSATQSFSVKFTPTVFVGEADAVPGLSSEELSQLDILLTYDALIFNELHNASDDAADWLELRNVSGADIPLDDWSLSILAGAGGADITFPAGALVPAGEVLLLVNTEPTMADASVSSIVSESFALPQSDFALILRSPTQFGDIAGNYFEGDKPETAPALTADTVWHRTSPIASGYRAEAWAVSGYQNGLGTPGYLHPSAAMDMNNDGVVNIFDLVLVASQFGRDGASAADLNDDGVVSVADLVLVADAFGSVGGAPGAGLSTAGMAADWLRLARESGVGQSSIAYGFSYERGIATLEALARLAVPETTALLANYPNPFNPETWMPYQLAQPAEVTMSIHSSNGSLIRTMELGHQPAGMYHNRRDAAYWDGANDVGETVASGVYFYTLTAGAFSATRKMIILK